MSYEESMRNKAIAEAKIQRQICDCILNTARRIFEYCGNPQDLCIQSVNETEGSIVFGGWNRVYYHTLVGWSASMYHCNETFYSKFIELKDLDFGPIRF